jgi:hypothetical protein
MAIIKIQLMMTSGVLFDSCRMTEISLMKLECRKKTTHSTGKDRMVFIVLGLRDKVYLVSPMMLKA